MCLTDVRWAIEQSVEFAFGAAFITSGSKNHEEREKILIWNGFPVLSTATMHCLFTRI